MELTAGTVLEHCRLIDKIGEGGMGAVWRAEDTSLGREVALKVLPPQLAGDAERLARFEQEARLLATLNHPNVAAIYGLHEHEGLRFLTMELVPGTDLAARLERGRLPVPEALDITTQLAEALEAAHEKGVVHRDLKPANVMLTHEGRVKVLDFGLAKAMAPDVASGSTAPSMSPTMTSAGTVAGMILGTAAYMSPEQARGKPVDRRADVWGFGCVVYEMLAGKQAFGGETVSDAIARLLAHEPDWDALAPDTPRGVRRLLQRFLEKDIQRRPRDAGLMRIEIEDTADDEPEEGTPAPTAATPRASRGPLVAVGIAALALGAALVWALKPDPSPRPLPLTRTAIALESDMRLVPGGGARTVAISPDGRTVAFAGRYDRTSVLYVRDLGRTAPVALDGTEGALNPFFSPDGRSLGFYAGGQLKRISLDDGAVVTLCDAPSVRGAAWAPDDTIYFPMTQLSGLYAVGANGGQPRSVTTLDEAQGELSHRWPSVLPGGRGILFTVEQPGSFDNAHIELLHVADGRRELLAEGGSHPVYSPSGHIVYARSDELLAVPFDLDRLQVTGPELRLSEAVLAFSNSGSAEFDIAADGSFIAISSRAAASRYISRFASDGTSERLTDDALDITAISASPDGRHVAMCLGQQDIWVLDIERRALTRLTTDPAADQSPVWSVDGRYVVFGSTRQGPLNLFAKAVDGSGPARLIVPGPTDQHVNGDINIDGTFLFNENRQDTGFDMLLYDPATGERTEHLVTEFDEWSDGLSPDGKWNLIATDASGRFEIHVAAFPGPGAAWQVSTTVVCKELGAPTAGGSYYRENESIMSVEFDGDAGRVGRPEVAVESPILAAGVGRTYAVAPDGSIIVVEESDVPSTIELVLNWAQTLD